MSRVIQNFTNVQNAQTMFVNWDRGSYYDEVLCFHMRHLVQLNVNSKEVFFLVRTFECEGCRVELGNMSSMEKVAWGLMSTDRSLSHPEGVLKVLSSIHGCCVAPEMRSRGDLLTIQNLVNEFVVFLSQNPKGIQNQ